MNSLNITELNDFSKYHELNAYLQVLQREDSLSALSERTVAVCVAVSSLNITNSIIIGQCCRVCCRLQCVLADGQVVLQKCCRVRCRRSPSNSILTRYFQPVVKACVPQPHPLNVLQISRTQCHMCKRALHAIQVD